jgi:hypothetical protein
MLRRGVVWIAVACLAHAGSAFAQAPTPPESLPSPQTAAPAAEPVTVSIAVPTGPTVDRYWLRIEYMTWFLPQSTIKFPIVTTGDTAVQGNCVGVVGQPGTTVLLNSTGLSNERASGLRFVFGDWLAADESFGIEMSIFTNFQHTQRFADSSDANGNPGLYLSSFSTIMGAEDAALISEAASKFGGSINITNRIEMWGVELNALFNITRTATTEWSWLAGLRYWQIRETFDLSAVTNDLVLDQRTAIHDHFAATNDIIGGHLGLRFHSDLNRVTFDVAGKIFVGANSESRNIEGTTAISGIDAVNPGVYPVGFFAEPTNIGRTSRVVFVAIPSAEVRIGIRITDGITATIGYEVQYVSDAIRSTDQIDRNLNLSAHPVFGSTPQAFPVAPGSAMRPADFFAHSLSFGLDFHF